MFCVNCGASVPENARFCPSCGQKVVMSSTSKDVERQVEERLSQMDPAQREELFEGIARALMAPLEDLLSHFESIARNGPVTDEDVEQAVELFKQEQSNTLVPTDRNAFIKATLPFVIAHNVRVVFQRRWFAKEVQGEAKKKLLWEDFKKYHSGETFTDRVEALLKIVGPEIGLNDDLIRYFVKLDGLRIWLEDECLKDLLLVMRVEKVDIPKDVLYVVFSRLDLFHPGRSKKIAEYVSSVMRYVKG